MMDFDKYLEQALGTVKFENDIFVEVIQYDIVKEVSQLLLDTRTRMNISQKELAQKTGITQANISKIENGHTVPSLPVLKRLADGLGKRLVVEFIEEEEV